MKFENIKIADLTDVVSKILDSSAGRKIFLLEGEMGAGKTNMIREFCRQLSVTDSVSSPTYAIVQEYFGKSKVVHLDLFRLKMEDEMIQSGIDQYLSGKDLCFVEWPALSYRFIPSQYVRICITRAEENSRNIDVEFYG